MNPLKTAFASLFVFFLFSTTFAQVNLSSGLVAYYPFSGNANDASGNNIHGTISGATLTTDRSGNANSAYLFNGGTSYIQLPASNLYNFSPTGTHSISVWVQVQSNPFSTVQAILVKSPYTSDHYLSAWNYGIYIEFNRFMVGYASTHVLRSNTLSTLDGSCWYHVLYTYDNGKWKLYVNGNLEAQDLSQSLKTLQDNSAIAFGKKGEAFGDYYKGKLDEVRIYNRVLNDAEIQALYNNYQSPCSATIVQPSFTAPDTVCVKTPFSITNTTTGGSTFRWNFCSPDLSTANPEISSLGSLTGLAQPKALDFAFESGNYYGFAINQTDGKLIRLNFGGSLLNNPTVTALPGYVSPIYDVTAHQLVKQNGQWYLFLLSNGSLYKIEFGSSLTNTSPTINYINTLTTGVPYQFYFYKDNTYWKAIMSYPLTNEMKQFTFDESLSNTLFINSLNIAPLNQPKGFSVVNDNGTWRMFVLNAGLGSITRVDFGSSLSNLPTSTNLGVVTNASLNPTDIFIVKQCSQAVGYISLANGTSSILTKLSFSSLSASPVTSTISNTSSWSGAKFFSRPFYDGSDIYRFAVNNNGSIYRYKIAGCNNASIPGATSFTPPAISYNTPGTYYINLLADENMYTEGSFCKKIVVMPQPVNTTPLKDTSTCIGVPIVLTTAFSNASSYTWTPLSGLGSTNAASTTANPIVLTKYYVTATSTYGCTAKDSTTVTVNPLPALSVTPTYSICLKDSVTLSATGTGTFSWSPSTGLNTTTGNTPHASPSATTKYYVTLTNTQKCSSKDSVTVTVNPLPVITKSADVAICTGGSTTLTASSANAGSYNWSPSAGLSSTTGTTTTANPASTTKYYITVTSPAGCISKDSITVTVNTATQPATQNKSTCANDSVQLQSSVPSSTYLWNTGATTFSIFAKSQGKFWVRSSFNGCFITDTFNVTLLPTPSASAVVSVDTTGVDMVTFSWSSVAGAATYEVSTDNGNTWTLPSSGPTGLKHTITALLPQTTVTLLVRALGAGGTCKTLSAKALATTKISPIFIPNAFTPNSDGLNDVWLIYGSLRGVKAMIYNQWGEKIFESDVQSKGWNGYYKGKEAPFGVYFYVAKLTLLDGSEEIRKGSINLIR
jgi:gliding motility-associated-like protein